MSLGTTLTDGRVSSGLTALAEIARLNHRNGSIVMAAAATAPVTQTVPFTLVLSHRVWTSMFAWITSSLIRRG